MDFETPSNYCAAAGNGSALASCSGIREGNTQSGRQDAGMDSTTAGPAATQHGGENEKANTKNHIKVCPEGEKGGIVSWGEVTPPGERKASNSGERSDSSNTSNKSTRYTIRETDRAGHVDDFTQDGIRPSFAGTSQDLSGIVHAITMKHAPPLPTAPAKVPAQRLASIESTRAVTLSALAAADTNKSATISPSIVRTEYLSVTIPANVRAYEELFRRCVSPAASASPTSSGGKTGCMISPRKSSTCTDEGNPSLNRFETLSTQPSHPRLYADDADDSSPPLVPAALLTSLPEPEDETQHSSNASAGDERKPREREAMPLENKIDEAVGPFADQEHPEQFTVGTGTKNEVVVNSEESVVGTTGCSWNSDSKNSAGGTQMPKQERKEPSSLLLVNTRMQDSTACDRGDVSHGLELPFDIAVAPHTVEPARAPQCPFMEKAASGTAGERREVQENKEEITSAGFGGGSTGRNNGGTSFNCGGPLAMSRQTSCVHSSTSQAETSRVSFGNTAKDNVGVTRSSVSCGVSVTTGPTDVAPFKVATRETDGEGRIAETQEHAAYAPADGNATSHSTTAEEPGVVGRDDVSAPAASARRDGNAVSPAGATTAAPVVLSGTTASVENRAPRGAAAGGEGCTPVGPRGRPSLGAAGRQLLLDRIRAKYHTNVGLYSGVLRKNYNSTISKLPFFTVSLLHQLAADFGIDTNAVLEQQQQHHYDSTRGSSARHSGEAGYMSGGRGGRQGNFVGATQARGGAVSSSGGFHLRRSPAAERRTLLDEQGTTAYSTAADKRRGRLHYEGLTRRRCAPRAAKKSGSASDGTVGLPPEETGESVGAARRRSLGLRASGTSWETEVIGSTARRTQLQQREENSFAEDKVRMQSGIISPEQGTEEQQRKVEKQHEQRKLDESTAGGGVSCIREQAAVERKSWTADHELSDEAGPNSTATGTAVRARAAATEARREEPGQHPPTAHDEPSSSVGCETEDGLGQERWRTPAEVPLLLREQGREQRRLLMPFDSMDEGEENEGRKCVADRRVPQLRSVGESSLASKSEHSKWLSGITAPHRVCAVAGVREHRQPSAFEMYAGASSCLNRPGGSGDAAFVPWSRDLRANRAAAVLAAEEKRRNAYSNSAFAPEGAAGMICGSPGDGETPRAQAVFKEDAPACGLPHARYLWSVLFGQLPEESGRALHSAVVEQELRRAAAAGEKCDDVALEYRAGAEKCLPHSKTSDVLQQLTVMGRDRREIHGATNLHLATPEPKEAIPAAAGTVPGAGGRGLREGVTLCRGREWVSRVTMTKNESLYKQNAAAGISCALAAASDNETAFATGHVTEVERLLEANARALDTEHLRKRLKTEVLWPQREDELHSAHPALHPEPATSSHSGRSCFPCMDPQDSSLPRGNRRVTPDEERILALLARRSEEVSRGGGAAVGARAPDSREAAGTCFPPKTSGCAFKHGTSHGHPLNAMTDCKSFTVTRSTSEDRFPPKRMREGEVRQDCTEERKEGWREPMQSQQKSAFPIRPRNNGSSGRDESTQTEGRLTGEGLSRLPYASLTADVDDCQRHQNGLNSSLMVLQQQEHCRRELMLAATCRKHSIQSACVSGEHNGELEGHSGTFTSPHKCSLVEPWWLGSVDAKLTSDATNTLSSVAVPPQEQLTPSCTSTLPSSCRTSLVGCNLESPALPLELKRHQQQPQQHQRHRMLLYNRNKLTSSGGAKAHMHMDLETGGNEPPSHGWLSRGTSAGKIVPPSYAKRPEPGVPDLVTADNCGGRDVWPSTSAATQTAASGDTLLDTVPLASLLPSSLLSEGTAKTEGSNSSSSASGDSRYSSRVVALLQTLSELQRRLASMQLPPQSPQQQSNRPTEETTGETKHSFFSPSSSSTGTTTQSREKLSPLQRASDLNVPGVLSTLLPALLQKVDDRYSDAVGTGTRQRADVAVKQQLLQQMQQRKQGVFDAADRQSTWLCDKSGIELVATLQEESNAREINYYGIGETSASSSLRRQEPADTPLALELVENFLKAQGLSSSGTSYTTERQPSLISTSQDGGCGRHSSSTDRRGRQTAIAVDSQGLAETGILRKPLGNTNDVGETRIISGTEEALVMSHTEDKCVRVVKDESGNLHERRGLQPSRARYNAIPGSQQGDRYGVDHLDSIKPKNQCEEEGVRQMGIRAVNRKTAAVFAEV